MLPVTDDPDGGESELGRALGSIPDAALLVLSLGSPRCTRSGTSPTSSIAPPLRRTDVMMGVVLIMLVLEATRRTVGWILPIVAVGSSSTANTAICCRVNRATAGMTSTAWSAPSISRWKASSACRWTSRRPISSSSRSTARCWNIPAPASSSSTSRSPPSADRRAGRADDDAGRVPAGHRLRERRGDDRHPRLGRLADAAPGGV